MTAPAVRPQHTADAGAWVVEERPAVLDDATVARLGNKFLVGNGYLGYRGTLDEYGRDGMVSVIVSGLYDQVGDLWREPVNLPNGGLVEVEYAGEILDARTSMVEEHAQRLNLRAAVHERHTTYVAGDGTRLTVTGRRFASLASPHLLVSEYAIEASGPCSVIVRTGVDGDVWDANGPHLTAVTPIESGEVVAVSACTHERSIPIAVAECLLDVPPAGTARVRCDHRRAIREMEIGLEPGAPAVVRKVSAYHSGLDARDPLAAAIASCAAARGLGYATLLADHAARWESRWRDCDVRIEGDEAAETALRFSTYHLLSVAPTHAQDVSIPARGLSGQVYKGAIFWDTEIFMLPFFIHEFPELARNLLLYRYHTLEGARRKAREYSFRGAFYAWESQDDGDDACTLFNVTDVFTNRPMRTYFRDRQFHISADIAHAIWNYVEVSGDDSILLDGAAEVVYECARFFTSCTYFHPLRGRYEILDVTGPDEYHERVHNNAYTNWMAGRTFDVCLRLDEYLSARHPAFAAALRARLGYDADLATIRVMAARLYRPAAGPDSPLVPQFDGYFDLEDVPLAELLARKLHPHEYLGGGNGLATTTQILKQADVVLGMYLLGDRFSADVKAANWTYYEPRTEHGSSLSECSYSLVAAETDNRQAAYAYFMRAASIDIDGNGKQFVGPLYIGGTHPAANGGAWMAAVLGLCGLHCDGATLVVEPHLPSHWRRVEVPLTLRGRRLRLTLTHDRAVVASDAEAPTARRHPEAETLTVRVAGREHSLPVGDELTIELRRAAE